jgi:hypothetical protein
MLRPVAYITVTQKDSGASREYRFVNSFTIKKSFENLTDTAEIVFPNKIRDDNDSVTGGRNIFGGSNPLFKRGDKIKIEAGYYPDRYTHFEGYISYVNANIPVQLKCEDYMFLMKQYKVTYPKTVTAITVSKKGKPLKRPRIISAEITLKQLMDYIFWYGEYNDLLDDLDQTTPYKIVDDIKLGRVRFNNMTPAEIFQKLRSDFGLYTYFVGNQLYCGFGFDAVSTKESPYVLEEVGIDTNDLDFQKAEEVRVKVVCVSMLDDNTKIQVEAGDSDGEQRTYHFYNIKNEAELKKQAENRVASSKYTGYKGKFKTFGYPVLEHGDRCKLISRVLPERDGAYLINAVDVTFSVDDGYRQIFDIGMKVS